MKDIIKLYVFKNGAFIINLSVLALLVSSCFQSTPGGGQGDQSEQEDQESETPQITILFDESSRRCFNSIQLLFPLRYERQYG